MEDTAPVLTAAEARLLGCLIEKEATTPETYPLTVNAAQSAANAAQLHDVVRNTFIQGTLSIVFASVVAVVVVAGIMVSIRAVRGTASTSEPPPVPSKRFAPAGLTPTAAERKVQAQWDARCTG